VENIQEKNHPFKGSGVACPRLCRENTSENAINYLNYRPTRAKKSVCAAAGGHRPPNLCNRKKGVPAEMTARVKSKNKKLKSTPPK